MLPYTQVRSRFLLGVLGILVVVASLAVALGSLSLLGLHTTLIVWEVRPFTRRCRTRCFPFTLNTIMLSQTKNRWSPSSS